MYLAHTERNAAGEVGNGNEVLSTTRPSVNSRCLQLRCANVQHDDLLELVLNRCNKTML